MKIQLWRNATVLLNINGVKLLIDPMLGAKGSFGVFPWTNDTRLNPLIDLPFSETELNAFLFELDAVLVTHLHPDHWDETAVHKLDKNLPVICPQHIAGVISGYGFQEVVALETLVSFKNILIQLTKGKHGRGEIGEKMGVVNGFVFSSSEESIYFAGDTILCEDVVEAIEHHSPDTIVVAGGAATFAIGDPVTMTSKNILELCVQFPNLKIVVTHLQAVSPCCEGRAFVKKQITKNGFLKRCFIPEDGEVIGL